MNLVFFGSGAFGLPTLQALARHHTLRAVVTQPDKPAGRGGTLTPTPIGAWAAEHLPSVPLLKPVKVNAPEVVDQLRGCGADAWVVIAFGQKLSRRLLDGVFAINLHASLLPRWRGAAPINAAVLAGDEVTGNSVITLADTMDAGLVLGTTTRRIERTVTAGELHDALSADGPALVEQVLQSHAAGTISPVTQDESRVTLAGKFSKADGMVDFTQPAAVCRCRVNGLNPWPGVTVMFRSQPLKLLRVDAIDATSNAPAGSVTDPQAGLVACGDGAQLKLLEVQPAGGKAMLWADFARGRQPKHGECFTQPPAADAGKGAPHA